MAQDNSLEKLAKMAEYGDRPIKTRIISTEEANRMLDAAEGGGSDEGGKSEKEMLREILEGQKRLERMMEDLGVIP